LEKQQARASKAEKRRKGAKDDDNEDISDEDAPRELSREGESEGESESELDEDTVWKVGMPRFRQKRLTNLAF
jgi:hypothetical protein